MPTNYFNNKQDVFTYTLSTSTLTIVKEYGVTAVAMQLTSGTGSYTGSKRLGDINSTPIELVVDKPVTVSAEQGRYIDDFLIDASAGIIEIIAR